VYIRRVVVTATMGPGIRIDLSSLSNGGGS
jgi:ribosomal protein L1